MTPWAGKRARRQALKPCGDTERWMTIRKRPSDPGGIPLDSTTGSWTAPRARRGGRGSGSAGMLGERVTLKAGLGLGQGQGAGNQTAVPTRRRGPNRREPGARASWGQRAERARQCSRAPAVTSGCGSALTTSPSTQGPAGTPDLCSGREAAWRPCTAGGPAGHALAPRPCFCHELGPGKA